MPALLPFFVDQRGYSYTAAGALVFAATVGSSLIQPLFGHAADRLQLPWLMAAGVLMAGAGIGLAGSRRATPLTFAAIVLSGIGVAAFHPEAARHANFASGEAKAKGMSLFALGGNAGFALGPALTSACVLGFGLSGTLALAAIPARAGALLFARRGRWRPACARRRGRRCRVRRRAPEPLGTVRAPDRRDLSALVRLLRAARLRAGLVRQLARHLRGRRERRPDGDAGLRRGRDPAGGRVADRVGRRTVLLGCLAAIGPLIAAFVLAPAALAFPLIALVGWSSSGRSRSRSCWGRSTCPAGSAWRRA